MFDIMCFVLDFSHLLSTSFSLLSFYQCFILCSFATITIIFFHRDFHTNWTTHIMRTAIAYRILFTTEQNIHHIMYVSWQASKQATTTKMCWKLIDEWNDSMLNKFHLMEQWAHSSIYMRIRTSYTVQYSSRDNVKMLSYEEMSRTNLAD